MKMNRMNTLVQKVSILIVLFIAVAFSPAHAQLTPGEILKVWKDIESTIVSSAKAMPEKYFIFKPDEDVPAFYEIINHITALNYLYGKFVKLEPVEDAFDEWVAKEKGEVICDLEKSFKHFETGLKKLSREDLETEVNFLGREVNRMHAIVFITSQLTKEFTKMIYLMRLKKIVPICSCG